MVLAHLVCIDVPLYCCRVLEPCMPNSNQCITNVGGGCICIVENMSKKWLEYLHNAKNLKSSGMPVQQGQGDLLSILWNSKKLQIWSHGLGRKSEPTLYEVLSLRRWMHTIYQ
jgi:hypothetical protein